MCLLLWFRPFTMAENSLVDSKFKGMTHSAICISKNQPDTYSTDLLTHLKILRIEKTLSIALLLRGWSGEDSLLQACVVNYKSSLMVFLIETVEFMPLKLEFPFDAEK